MCSSQKGVAIRKTFLKNEIHSSRTHLLIALDDRYIKICRFWQRKLLKTWIYSRERKSMHHGGKFYFPRQFECFVCDNSMAYHGPNLWLSPGTASKFMPTRTKSLLSCWAFLCCRSKKTRPFWRGPSFRTKTLYIYYRENKSQSHAFYAKFGLSFVLESGEA